MYDITCMNNKDKNQKFKTVSLDIQGMKKQGYHNCATQRIENISDFDRDDIRIHHKDGGSLGVVQMTRSDFSWFCARKEITAGRMGPMTDREVLEILTACRKDQSRFEELVRQLSADVPIGSSEDMSFSTLNGIRNIVQQKFPDVELSAFWEDGMGAETGEKEDTEAFAVLASEEEVLTPFHSDTDEDMPIVYTFSSDKKVSGGRRKDDFQKHDSMRMLSDTEVSHEKLEEDACSIHEAAGRRSELTIVCEQYRVKDGKYLRVCHSNGTLPPPVARDRAQELGYICGHGIDTHAEFNAILYSDKHAADLQFINHGCNRDTCPMCAKLLRFRFGKGVNPGKVRPGKRFSGKYKTRGIAKIEPKKTGSYMSMIRKYYNEEGKRIRKSGAGVLQ